MGFPVMIYPEGSSKKGNEARLFLDTGFLARQKLDKIYRIKKFDIIFIEF